MKYKIFFSMASIASLCFLSACNAPSDSSNDPLQGYVQQEIPLSAVDSSSLSGKLTFYQKVVSTVSENVCDKVQCGTELDNVCRYVDVCNMVTPPPVCKQVHGITQCVSGGPAQNVCNVEKQCKLQEMPKYCEVNCHMQTVTEVGNQEIDSALTVKVSGADVSKDFNLTLGLHTTPDYTNAFANPSSLPADLSYLFASLQVTDKTLLILNSSQYKLSSNANFLNLPADFKEGDALQINVNVETRNDSKTYSVLGTSDNLPGNLF